MFGLLYTAAYLLVRQIQIDAPKIKHVAPVIREITSKLPESERQAKADALWHDKKFVDATLDEAYREKNWPMAIFVYVFWGAVVIFLGAVMFHACVNDPATQHFIQFGY
jgi:hypothetical protein